MAYIVLEYRCPEGHVHDSMETRGEEATHLACPFCTQMAKRILSAPRVKIPLVTVSSRGKSDPLPPGAADTSLLADGMSRKEWIGRMEKQRRKKPDEDMVRQVRRVLDMPESRKHEL